jgi:hypothetical protein
METRHSHGRSLTNLVVAGPVKSGSSVLAYHHNARRGFFILAVQPTHQPSLEEHIRHLFVLQQAVT